jgi:hypothetical protein
MHSSDVRLARRPRLRFQGSEEARLASLHPNRGSAFLASVAVWQPACPSDRGQ